MEDGDSRATEFSKKLGIPGINLGADGLRVRWRRFSFSGTDMGVKNFGNQRKGMERKAFSVPSVSGDYAEQTIVFGDVASGLQPESFLGVTALFEGTPPSGARLELWLPKAPSGSEGHGDMTLEDYFYSGQCVLAVGSSAPTGDTASYASGTWAMSGVSGAMLRVKSAGAGGEIGVSAWAI